MAEVLIMILCTSETKTLVWHLHLWCVQVYVCLWRQEVRSDFLFLTSRWETIDHFLVSLLNCFYSTSWSETSLNRTPKQGTFYNILILETLVDSCLLWRLLMFFWPQSVRPNLLSNITDAKRLNPSDVGNILSLIIMSKYQMY